MELIIKNLAKVFDARILLRGMTVVAGPNGTGKSSISRALMILKTLNRNMSMLVAYERVVSIIASLRNVSAEMNVGLLRLRLPTYEDIGLWSEFLNAEFWQDEESVARWFKRYFFPQHNSEESLGFMVFHSQIPEPELRNVFERYRHEALVILEKDTQAYERHVCRKVLNTAFSENWLPYNKHDANGVLRLDFGSVASSIEIVDGDVAKYEFPGFKESESWVYLEPYHILDFVNANTLEAVGDRYVADGVCTLRLLQKKVQPPKDRTLEDEESFRKIRGVLDKIAKILGGHIYDNESGSISFIEDSLEDKFDVPILSIASGMKSLSALYRAIENRSLKEGGFLIIDEPESNLHPDWQLAFAQVLVAVRKELKVNILVTTHSPYMMRALEVFMDDEGRADEFEAYLMCSDEKQSNRMTIAKRVTESVEEIYREMYKPLERLRKSNNKRFS